MKKETGNQLEKMLREVFLADSPPPPEPPHWRDDTMRMIRSAAAAERNAGGWRISLRQERILWRSAWTALAVVALVCTVYFSLNHDLWDVDFASFTIVDMEGY